MELLRGGMELGDLKLSDTIVAVIQSFLCSFHWSREDQRDSLLMRSMDMRIRYGPFMVDLLLGAEWG